MTISLSGPSRRGAGGASTGVRRLLALLVDDEPENRALVRNMLQELGFHVLEADGGARALRLLQSLRPDLVCAEEPHGTARDLGEFLLNSPALEDVPLVALRARPGAPIALRRRAAVPPPVTVGALQAAFSSVLQPRAKAS